MLSEQEKNEGWISLFDGQTLNGWATTGNPEGWVVDSGNILCTANGGKYLYILEQYENFVLSVDFKMDDNVNSGIFFRWSNLDDPVHTGIEIQLLDSYGRETSGSYDCGAIYDMVAPTHNVCKPIGQWNNPTIHCQNNMITVEHNGEKITEMDTDQWSEPSINPDGTKNKFKYAWKDMPYKGHIGLQDHGGKIWFSHVKLKLL